jgi:methyl-accepting chemotaxis protein
VLLARSIGSSAAAGHLDQTLVVRSRDELGQMTESFQGMIGHLRQMTVEIRAGADQLNDASSELLAVVSQQSAGASEQAAAITQTTSTVEQLRASTEQIAEQAEAVLTMAERATEAASAGVAAVAAAASWTAESRDRVVSNQELGRGLWEQTQQIDDIIATVNDLADQSHVLAINAAIEANRAGEQGAAFAVVATEIRSLAEQSKAATQQVRTLLSEIARAANAVLATTEQGARGVSAGERLVAQAGQTIDELSAVILQTVDNAQRITMAVRQHTVAMEQITVAMREINSATTDSLTVTARTQDAAKSLSELAGHLDQLVGQFSTEHADSAALPPAGLRARRLPSR